MRVASVSCACEGCLLRWQRRARSSIPKEDLPAVSPSYEQRGVERGELGGEEIGSRMERVFWS